MTKFGERASLEIQREIVADLAFCGREKETALKKLTKTPTTGIQGHETVGIIAANPFSG